MKTRVEQATPLPAGVWTVDPQRSQIGFAVREMWGLRTVRGVFGGFEGTLTVRASGVNGELTIETGSVETGNKRRDKHLRSPAFFDVGRNPRILFTVATVTGPENSLSVIGDLSIGSSCGRLEIPVSIEPIDDGALRIEGKTTVSRQSAGLAWNMLGTIRGDAMVDAQITLERDG